MRNDSTATDGRLKVYPIARFATDFGRLLADVDRLMMDIAEMKVGANHLHKNNGVHRRRNGNGHVNGNGNGAAHTLQKRAQSFLSSLKHVASFHQRVPVAYMELDGDGNILQMNKECSDALHLAGQPILGSSLFTFIDGNARELRDQLAVCGQTGKPAAIGAVLKGKGTKVELRIRRYIVGKAMGYLAVLLDDSLNTSKIRIDQKTSESAIASIQELSSRLNRAYTLTSAVQLIGEYCNTILGSPEGMIFVEHEGIPQLAWHWQSNRAPKKHLTEEMMQQWLAKHAIGDNEASLWVMPTKRHPLISRYLRRTFPDAKNAAVALLPISISGEPPVGALAMVFLNRLNDETREHVHQLLQLASRCIARARSYDEALAARTEAERANQRKEQFLSVLSHELKSPLAPILGWAVALSSGTLAVDKQSIAIEGIIRNARALNYLIEDLFDVARISSGKLRLEIEEMRLQEVVREALTAIQPAAESKKLRIATDISEAIPPFPADARRVRQVLINLLNNAVKFTPNGGSIGLKVIRKGQYVQCSVSDSGRGIDPEFLPYVFERFCQEKRSSNVKGGGLGLGLTIVKEIAELHGGRVKAHSTGLDHGSTFTFELPIHAHKTAHAGK